MSNTTEILKNIMEVKNQFVKEHTGMILIPEVDMNFILELPEDNKIDIMMQLRKNIYYLKVGDTLCDGELCPHCIYANIVGIVREDCPYGKNNGVCNKYELNNLFGKIYDSLGGRNIYKLIYIYLASLMH